MAIMLCSTEICDTFWLLKMCKRDLCRRPAWIGKFASVSSRHCPAARVQPVARHFLSNSGYVKYPHFLYARHNNIVEYRHPPADWTLMTLPYDISFALTLTPMPVLLNILVIY
jgi:hypothetical protein